MKTVANSGDVAAFLAASPHPDDAAALAALMAQVTGEAATMWGPAIVGFGAYHYKYDSGREGSMCRVGFSPRKAALTVYGAGSAPRREMLLARLGKHTTGKGCVYIKRLADIDLAVLRDLIADGLAESKTRYPD